ncbi:hypothetical protein V6N13_088888 [Hibiscus sabdariffa]|uniref:Uncharacterized protein n=1 Tax=Hibiscus sabdariffa TaxID=183260 RepID=A0ABR2G1N0_9ROSI
MSTGNKKKESSGEEKPETPGPFEDVNPKSSVVGASRNEMQMQATATLLYAYSAAASLLFMCFILKVP